MPTYRVLKPAFLDGKSYGPDSKRKFYVSDKPLKPVPKALELVEESAPKRRTAEEADAKKKAPTKRDLKKKQPSKVEQSNS